MDIHTYRLVQSKTTLRVTAGVTICHRRKSVKDTKPVAMTAVTPNFAELRFTIHIDDPVKGVQSNRITARYYQISSLIILFTLMEII